MLTEQQKELVAWQALQEFDEKPFDWNGSADCCALANKILGIFHGKDFLSEFIYSNKAEALREIKKYGDLLGAVTHALGPPQDADPSEMQNADILLAMQESGEWIVGFYFLGCMCVPGRDGVINWPPEAAVHMWRPT